MTFTSFQFILLFLPACYVGFLLVHRLLGWTGVYAYLALASLAFYAMFAPILAAILVASVLFNYILGTAIRLRRQQKKPAGALAIAAIAANLFALGYFKYTNFFIDIANSLAGTGISHLDIIVPVGVSFFTFTQIGFLIEALNGQVKRVGLGKYALFATFFPCVTAGPLLLQRDIFGQMEDRKGSAFNATMLSVGLTMFGIGLFKKVILADSIAPYANLAFDSVALGAAIAPTEAWIGSLAYSLQLYFDFSGYSDMAVGLGFMFGMKLPLNFNSPFKATSISDFWRRWHMTMTRFFTTYLFTPMAMNNTRSAMKNGHSSSRKWLQASALPIFYTFVMAGIWHGAGYTFVVYGLIHGLALAIDNGWKHFKMPKIGAPLGWTLTMAVVVSGLVMFRAPSVEVATTMLASMWGITTLTGANFGADLVLLDVATATALIVALGAIVLLAPNSQQILRSTWISSDPQPEDEAFTETPVRWTPTPTWALIAAVVMVLGFTSLGGDTSFLYYSF